MVRYLRRRIGRPTRFFFLIAITGVVMIWPTPDKYRVVPLLASGLAFLWCILFFLEDLGRGPRDEIPGKEGKAAGDAVFAPPPHR